MIKPRIVSFVLVAIAIGLTLSAGPVQRGDQPGGKPDLAVSNIDFQKVKSGTDSGGKTYWIFNVIIKVRNQGNASAGAFKVLLERNNGSGGAYQTACQTCVIDVSGLGAGLESVLPPRQFNNANGFPSKFRATVDSAGQIAESNEGNNAREEAFLQLAVVVAGGGVSQIAKPDLTVLSFDFQNVSQSTVGGKTIVTFTVAATVKNLGPAPSPACHLDFMRSSDPMVCIMFQQKPVPALAANAQTVILSNPVTHELGTPGKYYEILVDSTNEIQEPNESNNLSTRKQYPVK